MSMSQTHKEMGEKAMQHLPCEGKTFESMTFQNSSLTVEVFGVLQSLQKNELLCDIKIQTSDGKLIHAHKVVLASASQFFLAMFTNFIEKDKDHIYMKSLNYTTLELIISYIYTGQIIVNEENVLDLLAAANFLLVDYIKDVCCDFLRTQLDSSNCIGIYQLANSHDCTELKACSELYIKTQFKEVVKNGDYLCLSAEELIEIISSNDLNAPLEQNVFETVINWVQQESDVRKQYFKNVMAHVRLPLIPNEYILNNIVGHPLVEISSECKNYVNYALHYNFNKTVQKITIPNKICCTRRSGNLDKIIFMLSWAEEKTYVNWYDPATNHWNITSKISQNYHGSGSILLVKDQFVVIVHPHDRTSEIIDLSSLEPCWIPMPRMKVDRHGFGVGLINHCVYVVGGVYAGLIFNTVMAFDISAQKWQRVASMSSKRGCVGVGVLNNLLYAVGGYNYSKDNMYLKSVECYDPSLGKWKRVAEMSEGRSDVSIGVLNGIIYAIGGYNKLGYCKYVEAYKPSDGFWTRKADLHLERMRPEVVILHGLIYVMAGRPFRTHNDSVEIYNPKTNTWKLMEACIKGRSALSGAVVIDRPPHF